MTRALREDTTFLKTVQSLEGSFFPMTGRALEVLLMPGFVVAAIPFAGRIPPQEVISRGLPLALATLLLVGSIYAVNTYFGFGADRKNRRFRGGTSPEGSRQAVFTAFSLVAGLGIFIRLQPASAWLAAAIFVLWFAYSMPGGAKSRPFWGTAVHWFSQVLQFHMGILAFGEFSRDSLLVSFFFAGLFASGHLVHEVKDSACDREAGIRTNAVAFGPKKVVSFVRFILFALPIYWFALFRLGTIDTRQFVPFFIATLGHLAFSRRWDGTTLEKNDAFQRSYRLLYLGAGLMLFALMTHPGV